MHLQNASLAHSSSNKVSLNANLAKKDTTAPMKKCTTPYVAIQADTAVELRELTPTNVAQEHSISLKILRIRLSASCALLELGATLKV